MGRKKKKILWIIMFLFKKNNLNKSFNFNEIQNHLHKKTFCCAKKKGVRLIVTLECTEARKEGGTPTRYITQKNKKNTPDRLQLMKYNSFMRKHTLHREIK